MVGDDKDLVIYRINEQNESTKVYENTNSQFRKVFVDSSIRRFDIL